MARVCLAIAVYFATCGVSFGGDAKKEARAKALRAEIVAIKAKLAELEKELASLGSEKSYAREWLYINELKVGGKGVLAYPSGDTLASQNVKVRIDRVLDNSTAILAYRYGGVLKYILVTMPTAGMVDDQVLEIDFPIHLKGTRKHLGRTYLHAEKIK